ncbi:hypothetical protein [Amycolatopsis albispora]|uniref:Uncharacterized protein n=1 Tax=Amycolatopsis albispora TaxID=1804986 RepID=A0A344LAE1_9PSEU|nr:hypothetical protein [Amycolatopsis albispora]AXB45015.1 hypothetical protein A4R43_23030 [Amycolatopsis albispora]
MRRSRFAEVVRIRLARDRELLVADGRLVGWRLADVDDLRLIEYLRTFEDGRLDVLLAGGPRDREALAELCVRLAECPAAGSPMAVLLIGHITEMLAVFDLEEDKQP